MNYPEHDKSASMIPLDVYTRSKISSTAKAAGVAAMLSIAGTIVSLIAYITKPSVRTGLAKEGFDDATIQATAKGSVLLVVFSAMISVVLFYTLYSFSKLTRKGLATDDRRTFNRGLFHLANYFKFIGILLLCALGFLFLSSLMMGMGAAI